MTLWVVATIYQTKMTLADALPTQSYSIADLIGDQDLVVKLLEFGFTKGEGLRVVSRSIFGSPICVEIRGAVIALRDDEAKCILLK